MENENAAASADASTASPFDPASVTLSKIDGKRLTDTNAANTSTPSKPFFAKPKDMAKLTKLGLVIGYESQKNPDNADQIAFGITANGSAVINAGKAQEAMDAATRQRAPVPESGFEIEDDVQMPAASTSGRQSMYPFEALKVGQGFFVANTEGRQDAYKSLSSTVSGKNKDGATMTPVRKFLLARGEKKINGVDTKGAWVKRES